MKIDKGIRVMRGCQSEDRDKKQVTNRKTDSGRELQKGIGRVLNLPLGLV